MEPDVTDAPTRSRWRSGSLLSRAVFATAVLVSMVMLFAPPSDVPSGPEGSDKVVHALMFAVLLIVGAYARLPLVVIVPVLIAYGGVAEIVQGLIGRDADFWDWVCDSCGVAIGVAVAAVVRSRHR
jgi:hypothetical protein